MAHIKVYTWFERDRAHVELINEETGATVIEWWDAEYHEAVTDGYLDPKNIRASAIEYAESIGLI